MVEMSGFLDFENSSQKIAVFQIFRGQCLTVKEEEVVTQACGHSQMISIESDLWVAGLMKAKVGSMLQKTNNFTARIPVR